MGPTNNQCCMEASEMKLTRILPRKLAVSWQEYDLNRTDSYLAHYEAMAKAYRQMSEEGHTELKRLRGGQNNDYGFNTEDVFDL